MTNAQQARATLSNGRQILDQATRELAAIKERSDKMRLPLRSAAVTGWLAMAHAASAVLLRHGQEPIRDEADIRRVKKVASTPAEKRVATLASKLARSLYADLWRRNLGTRQSATLALRNVRRAVDTLESELERKSS